MDDRAPLSGYEVLRTRDVDVARHRVGRTFADHRLTINGQPELFEARHHVVPLGSMALAYLDYGSEVWLNPGPIDDMVLVHMPLRGAVDTYGHRERVVSTPAMASIAQPEQPFAMHWQAGSPHLLVRFSETELRRLLGRMVAADLQQTLRFSLGQDLCSERMRSWLEVVRLVCRQVDSGSDLFTHPLAVRNLEQLLTSGFLLSSAHSGSELLHGPERSAAPRSLRLALDFLYAHLADPITVEEIAAAAGVGVRALQESFRRHLETTPTAYLRNLRLDQARADLLTGRPGTTSVTDVALRWGFVHLGRFAADYRKAFGESPRDTLLR
ncbi:AraC family transcriptional regulator [Kribbella sandramycini]|uniref:AraC family transcriptional regulator n=1 Tax=Kribbella sandramycini TaxID=60450 RepID=A0A7Y4KVZ3_9ACTN|nr:AraC family transcriptional regulator [Kribbella sandramycini]MBB6567665.1 AraC-like DNA-binding protein [Kribbella sandramycini]NOL39734.1 AraC family transcriptional regulator [Kribbella sandramycini]